MKTSTELTQRLKTGVAPTRFHCQATGVGQTRAESESTGRHRAVRAGTLTPEQAWPVMAGAVLGKRY